MNICFQSEFPFLQMNAHLEVHSQQEAKNWVLTNNGESLMEALSTEAIIMALMQRRIISRFEAQDIMAEPASYRKNYRLIDILKCRSVEEFHSFCDILRGELRRELADRLEAEFSQKCSEISWSSTFEPSAAFEGCTCFTAADCCPFSDEQGENIVANIAGYE